MAFQQALNIMVNGTDDSDERYDAIQVIESEVAAVSKYGNEDGSLQDWIAAGQYKLTDTPELIAAEWDEDRE